MEQVKHDYLQECYRIARYVEGEKDAEGFPVLCPGVTREHVRVLVERLQAYAVWRAALMERYGDGHPLLDLLVGGPSFPKEKQ